MLRQPEVILDRLEALGQYAAHLERFRALSGEEFAADIERLWAVEHGLQLCIQCVIDVCDYLVAQLGLGVAATHLEAVELLCQAGVLPESLRSALINMMRFRNILVHAYLRVDVDKVRENLQKGLPDFAEFARCVLEFLRRNGALTGPVQEGGFPPC